MILYFRPALIFFLRMVNLSKIFVVKRDGRKEPVHFDKITARVEKLCYNLDMDYIDPPQITLKVSCKPRYT